MTKSEVLEAIKQMSNLERLEIIELASRLMREEIESTAQIKVEGKLSLAKAVEIIRPYYGQGGELTELTDFNNEDFYKYEDYT